MDKNKRNKIILISLLIIIALGVVCLTIALKSGKNKVNNRKQTTTEQTTMTTTSSQVTSGVPVPTKSAKDSAAILFCKNNIDSIFNKINKINNNSFTSKYYKEDYITITSSNINCDSSYEIEANEIYIPVETEKEHDSYIYNQKTNVVSPYNEMDSVIISEDDLFKMTAFEYAKKLVDKDKSSFENDHSNYSPVGSFQDKTYQNGNIYILKICKYISEDKYCPEHYYDYEINFSTRTFKRINIDIK